MSFEDFTYNEAVFFEIQANTPHKSLEKGSLPVVLSRTGASPEALSMAQPEAVPQQTRGQ